MKIRSGKERGQATVEMALVLPVLLWLLLGLVDVALAANASIVINNAAREGVRIGSIGASDAAIVQRVRDRAQTLDQTRLTVTVAPVSPRSSGTSVTVAVTYTYRFLSMFGLAGTDTDLRAQLAARVE